MPDDASSTETEAMHSSHVIKFIPFSSTVDSPFWVRYCHLKLETIRLKEDPIEIRASYGVAVNTNTANTNTANNANRLQCQESSLLLLPPDDNKDDDNNDDDKDKDFICHNNNNNVVVPNDRVACPGVLLGYNTKESFQKVDKNALLRDVFCEQFFNENKNDDENENDETNSSLQPPSLVLLTFADLKQHKVLYWFGFPTLMTKAPIVGSITTTSTSTIINSGGYSGWWMALANGLYRHRTQQDNLPAFFAVKSKTTNDITTEGAAAELLDVVAPLNRNYRRRLFLNLADNNNDDDDDDVVFGFVDPTAIGGNTTVTMPGSSSSSSSSSDGGGGVLMMGWPMRNLIAYLVLHLGLGGKTVRILSLRPGGCPGLRGRIDNVNININNNTSNNNTNNNTSQQQQSPITAVDADQLAKNSVLMKIKLPLSKDYDYSNDNDNDNNSPQYKVVGWELNARQKPGPRYANLRPLLDQNHLAIQAADLNLKLMKWRMIPDLKVDMLQKRCKVLLLGAGTLGCSVARTLLGWGIRDFKFVDYGNVSYSNPVRQVLFGLEDCHFDHGQGKPKAQAAADALKRIAADVTSEGIRLSIPMPGHAAENGNDSDGNSSLKETVERLDQLIQEADAVFLLTDTRESRWLPTVMAAVHDKILINAALGLDSWLVMRHGGGEEERERVVVQEEGCSSTTSTSTQPPRLGCYFCNDVVAPENSTKNRTLDQQCTVTRPGLAPIASSMAVEMLVSLLHHPQRQRAPPPPVQTNNNNSGGNFSPTDNSNSSSSPLGVIPHQIRGSIVTYTMMTPSVPAFHCCTGCSVPILEAYRTDKFELVSRACASMDGSYLENISGLTVFRADAAEQIAEMMMEGDDDDDDCFWDESD